MTFTDYIFDLALIGIVLLQIRGRRLSAKTLLIPVAIVAYVADQYLKGIPTGHNDLVLEIGCAAIGATLGALAGVFTSVKPGSDGRLVSKAGAVAAILWVLGVGARFAFQLYATHGGGASIERFSAAHGINGSEAWTAALILMAIGEVVFRTGVIVWKAYGRKAFPEASAPIAVASEPVASIMSNGGSAA